MEHLFGIQKGSIGSIMADERKVVIDEVELEVDGSMTLIQACEEAGIEIPRFAIMNVFPLQEIVECVWLR